MVFPCYIIVDYTLRRKNMDKQEVLKIIINDKYYTMEDLRYNQKIGIKFSKEQFQDFLKTKDDLVEENLEFFKKIPLKTFNSKHCFYVEGNYLLSTYMEYLQMCLSDLELNQSSLFDRNAKDMLTSRLFSEIEGSLDIENIPTTQTKIAEVQKEESLTETNDIIIKNMLDAIVFIIDEKPEFNKNNLLKLYNILSKDSLPESKKLKKDAYYRHDKVYVGGFEGADFELLDEYMDSLFEFANNQNYIKKLHSLLPFICHYYILYLHPYFDFNGRTARMVSFWLNYIYDIEDAPYFMSEAINETKKDYYKALANTRLANNDLTYFLGYLLETSIKFSFVYKNLEEIKNLLLQTGDTLSSSEWVYLKKILVHNPDGYFNYKKFLEYIRAKMTKQGALKILNNLVDYEILECIKNKRNESMYRINPTIITYKYH